MRKNIYKQQSHTNTHQMNSSSFRHPVMRSCGCCCTALYSHLNSWAKNLQDNLDGGGRELHNTRNVLRPRMAINTINSPLYTLYPTFYHLLLLPLGFYNLKGAYFLSNSLCSNNRKYIGRLVHFCAHIIFYSIIFKLKQLKLQWHKMYHFCLSFIRQRKAQTSTEQYIVKQFLSLKYQVIINKCGWQCPW